MRFRLRYLKHDLELTPGTFVIGRSAECQLSLDDPLVSRRHALLLVGDDEVNIEDAGSRNGISVNGQRIHGRQRLDDGDRVTIGAQEMTIATAPESKSTGRTWLKLPAPPPGPVTIVSLPVAAQSSPPDSSNPPPPPPPHAPLPVGVPAMTAIDEPTIARPRRGEALKVLGGVADKALALGNPESAERLLQNPLADVLTDVRLGRNVPGDTVDLAARFAARLASALGKGTWGDYVISLYSRRTALPPAGIVDELYVATRKMRGFDLAALRVYLDEQHARAANLTPNERFVLQRLDGLERLIATR